MRKTCDNKLQILLLKKYTKHAAASVVCIPTNIAHKTSLNLNELRVFQNALYYKIYRGKLKLLSDLRI